MAGVVFDVAQNAQVARWLEQGMDKAAKRALLATSARLVAHIQTEVIPNLKPQPVDKGLYRAAWRFKRTPEGAEIYNTAPYASHIEYGVRAKNIKVGRLMINALAAWVKRKGIASGKETRGVAFAIAMDMKKRGIFQGGKGFRVIEKALTRVREFVDQAVADEVRRQFRE